MYRFVQIIRSGVYGKRHWDLANLKVDGEFTHCPSEHLCHRVIGPIECVPFLGTLAAAVDGWAGGAFSKKPRDSDADEVVEYRHKEGAGFVRVYPISKVDKKPQADFIIESPMVENNPITGTAADLIDLKCLNALSFTMTNGSAYRFWAGAVNDLELRAPKEGADDKIYRMYKKGTEIEICRFDLAEVRTKVTLTQEGIDLVKSRKL